MSSSSTNLTTTPDAPPENPRTQTVPQTNGVSAAHSEVEEVPSTPDGRPKLVLTDFLDVQTLVDIQESFASVARLKTVIRDAQGHRLVAPADAQRKRERQIIDQLVLEDDLNSNQPLTAPIEVDGQVLGSISVETTPSPTAGPATGPVDRAKLEAFANKLAVPIEKLTPVVCELQQACSPNRAAAVQFLYIMANSIARLCYDEQQLRQRVEELSSLHQISTLMSTARSLQDVLDTAVRSVVTVMKVRAATIRLLDDDGDELILKAYHNLSEKYINKGPVRINESEFFQISLEKGWSYVEDMATDTRIAYPEQAREEGLISMLNVSMVFHDRPIGVLRIYTGVKRVFTPSEIQTIQSVGSLLATSIERARLDAETAESQRIQRQLVIAADVQRRMLPAAPPKVPNFQFAARYVPSFELGGDFYDFIQLDGHTGVAVGDVVGKGIAAGLLMASVRASLRAYAQDVYDLDEIISRVNIQLTRDTLDNEFATLFYGVFDPQTLRLTYCNAGHEPPLLLRKGMFIELDTGGMIVGIDEHQQYEKGLLQLEVGDLLLIYTDGLSEAMDFGQRMFGKDRIRQALLDAKDMTAQQALNHVLWQMRRYVGLNRGSDDLTLVTVRVTE
ncbi:MAG: SpoIIE family protein phosphatase [Phycisphaera sp.]|nr:SpoIIE family protein phosphatase [Phycisphaera sp.]